MDSLTDRATSASGPDARVRCSRCLGAEVWCNQMQALLDTVGLTRKGVPRKREAGRKAWRSASGIWSQSEDRDWGAHHPHTGALTDQQVECPAAPASCPLHTCVLDTFPMWLQSGVQGACTCGDEHAKRNRRRPQMSNSTRCCF